MSYENNYRIVEKNSIRYFRSSSIYFSRNVFVRVFFRIVWSHILCIINSILVIIKLFRSGKINTLKWFFVCVCCFWDTNIIQLIISTFYGKLLLTGNRSPWMHARVLLNTKRHLMMNFSNIKIDLCSFIRFINIYERHLWLSNYRIIEFMKIKFNENI